MLTRNGVLSALDFGARWFSFPILYVFNVVLRYFAGTFPDFLTSVPGVSLWVRTTIAVLDGRAASDS